MALPYKRREMPEFRGEIRICPCKSKANCENNDRKRTRVNAANVFASRNDGLNEPYEQ